ncbi:hypothetical protein [Micromonospora aurantiaca (nom. illeg.)]|uniref:hypothetical protein n=1 Tax=Micromonospora aurantiaca (nom. illeg.) TaxID=47850 RepID=UPI003F4A3366
MSAVTAETFLDDEDVREITWHKPAAAPVALSVDRVLIAEGSDAFEVLLATAQAAPRTDDVRRLWSLRWNRRAAPVVLVVAYQAGGVWKAAVCGTRDDPDVFTNLGLAQVERICAAALAAPDPATAARTLHRLLASLRDQLAPGLTNSGLFASHELGAGVPARTDWTAKKQQAEPLLRLRGTDLIQGLGFASKPQGSTALLLSARGVHQAIAVLLDEQDVFDRPVARFGAVSPVAHGLAAAQANNVPWLVVLRGTQIRLYSAKPDIGVGRKGQTETFLELDLALLGADDGAYLTLLLSADALATDGTVTEILRASADHAAALGERLRERVYVDVVPDLAKAVAGNMGATSEGELAEAYHRTLIILFRLLFIAYAEDRGLLPYLRNPRYTKRALKTLAREFADNPDLEFDPDATDRWDDLLAVWRAIDDGNREWGGTGLQRRPLRRWRGASIRKGRRRHAADERSDRPCPARLVCRHRARWRPRPSRLPGAVGP